MEYVIGWGAFALLIIFVLTSIIWLNVYDRKIRREMTPEQRKDDDYETDAFIQHW